MESINVCFPMFFLEDWLFALSQIECSITCLMFSSEMERRSSSQKRYYTHDKQRNTMDFTHS